LCIKGYSHPYYGNYAVTSNLHEIMGRIFSLPDLKDYHKATVVPRKCSNDVEVKKQTRGTE
jgi:hypothetical protein